MTTTNAGAGPDSLTHQSCYDNSDCDFACFAADSTFYREFSLISIQSSYGTLHVAARDTLAHTLTCSQTNSCTMRHSGFL